MTSTPRDTNTNEVIAGSSDDFMLVRHITVAGSQPTIGGVLAREANRSYRWTPAPADPVKARARRAWFARHWPQHLGRMQGAAEELGIHPETDEVHLDGTGGIPFGSACSASFYPPQLTVDGRGVLGRNYDFFTTTQSGLLALLDGRTVPPSDEMPWSSRPYVITTLPDDGPASTVLTMNELDGCMDGINEHGLAVVLLMADVESTSEPVDAGPQVGIAAGSQLPRFLLDTCATAAQALEALLDAKQYDLGVPLHYLVTDRSGDAFVWERGSGGAEYVVRADGGALCVTNHPLHRYRDLADLPADNEETALTYQRYRTIAERAAGDALSTAGLRDALDAVRAEASTNISYPIRTLWSTILDPERRTMSARFYLGDGEGGSPRYSPETELDVPIRQSSGQAG